METIDFVIAWVDGGDPVWQAEKAKYDTTVDETQDVIAARYRDWEIIRYWFRSVETYAPWVRRIHFVTWGHLPEWLNTDHPKLHVVRHEDYIPAEYLPTFNSHTIELNFHRIEGLAEQFVYFNDDMILTAPVKETDFFKKGLPCDTFALDAVFFAKDSAGAYNGNDLELINQHFNKDEMQKKFFFRKWFKLRYGIRNLYRTVVLRPWHWFPGFHYDHLASSFLKSVLEEVWEKEEETLRETCRDRFRSKRNVNQWIFKYWNLASGNFYPRRANFGKCFHLKKRLPRQLKQAISSRACSMVCINDTARTENFERLKREIHDRWEKVLPEKCSFEK